MTHRTHSLTQTYPRELFRSLFTTLMAVLLLICGGTLAVAADGNEKAHACAFSDAEFDPATDVHALEKYKDAIAQLLKQEKFADLDCIADAARKGKARFSGGAWKLANFHAPPENLAFPFRAASAMQSRSANFSCLSNCAMASLYFSSA